MGRSIAEREQNIVNYMKEAGLPDVKLNDDYDGIVAHFNLTKSPKSDSERKKIVLKAMDLMQGMDFEKIDKDAYYFNFGNTARSFGIIGILFEEFPGSRTGAHKKEFEYLQNRGLISIEIVTPLEPDMKDDERYTKPIDVDYA